MSASPIVLKALAVTAELTNTALSTDAARVMADDLGRYPEFQVLGALQKCRRELKGRLTVADVVTRLNDGRPGPEEAWSMIPRGEEVTIVWTAEMAAASGAAGPLLEEGDAIAARMAFLEAYRSRVAEARDAGVPIKWSASLGTDVRGREGPLLEAVQLGRISQDHAERLLPGIPVPALADLAAKLIGVKR